MGKKGKGKDKDGGAAGAAEDVKREQKLQAILLADSFTKTFRPMTREMPKVLLPLANVPMLEYSIEFLAQNGVQELFVFCASQGQQVKNYIKGSRWPETIDVHCITSSSCLSAGDALREIDSMGVVRSDPFILISGDVVSNMNLKEAMAFHASRRAKDSNCVMTCVLKEVGLKAGPRSQLDELVVGLDADTGQVLYYENQLSSPGVSVPLALHEGGAHPHILYTDRLMDTHVDICSPDLLIKYSDNFDYQDTRKDFIVNEVMNIELGSHIYSWTLREEYAARVADLKTYQAICQDIVSRWVYPLVPDTNLSSTNTTNYSCDRRGVCVYKEDGVKIGRAAVVGPSTVLGRGTSVGEGSHIHHTIVGRGCDIGANVSISHSNIWANVRIEDGCVLEHCCVADGAVVKKGSVLARGSVVSFNCVIGEGVTVPEFTRVAMYKEDAEDEEETLRAAPQGDYDVDVVGEDGRGYVWTGETGEDGDVDTEDGQNEIGLGTTDLHKARSMGCTSAMLWSAKPYPWGSVPLPEEAEMSVEFDGESLSTFTATIRELVASGASRGHSRENLLTEIKSYKFAHNREFSDCLKGVLPALLDVVGCAVSSTPEATKMIVRLKNQMEEWKDSLKELTVQLEDELVVLEALEDYVRSLPDASRAVVVPVFRYVLQIVYDCEIVSDAAVESWIQTKRDETAEEDDIFGHPHTQEFVEWFEADDDDDEEEDEEDDG